MSRAMLHCGDVRAVLAALSAESVQCVVTSPPYWGLRDYGVPGQLGLERTPEEYVANMVAVFREVRRVLRPDGICWLNLGDSYAGSWGNQGRKPERGTQRPINGGMLTPVHDGRYPSNGSNTGAVPPGLKPKDLVGIPWRTAFALQADGWWLRSDIIWAKCLSGGTTVYAKTQKGEMPMTVKDMVRLDPATVQLWDGGKWNQVVRWGDVPGDADRGKRSAKYRGEILPVDGDIELEFRSGERIGCTREHKWPTGRGVIQAADLVVGDIVPTVSLPEPTHPVSPDALDDKDCGWFVGMYMAEGSESGGTLQFAGHQKESERNARLLRIAQRFHGYCAVHYDDGNGCTANVNGPMLRALVETYVAGRTAKDKHLHPRCWSRSNGFLRSLLNGYLEGDGQHRENGSWRLGFTNNDALAADLRTLAARLGASVRLRRGVATNTGTGKKHKCWRGDLVFDRSLRRGPDGEIIAIRQSRARLFHNISLAEEPHSFALASGLCTKNSNPMPESVTDRPTRSHEYLFLLTKGERYFYDAQAIAEGLSPNSVHPNGTPKAGTMPRPGGAPPGAKNPGTYHRSAREMGNDSTRNARSVWAIATQPYPQAHFATFPEELARRCILAGSKPGDTVLDPFGGSGTVAQVATGNGRDAIYIDLNPKYLELAKQRIGPMFCEDAA